MLEYNLDEITDENSCLKIKVLDGIYPQGHEMEYLSQLEINEIKMLFEEVKQRGFRYKFQHDRTAPTSSGQYVNIVVFKDRFLFSDINHISEPSDLLL